MRHLVNRLRRVFGGAGLRAAVLPAWPARKDCPEEGGKIIADNVWKTAIKSLRNSAGQLRLPKSIVDHIEKGAWCP